MAIKNQTTTRIDAPKIKRPGVHSKTKTSNNKESKNYVKRNRGQGRS